MKSMIYAAVILSVVAVLIVLEIYTINSAANAMLPPLNESIAAAEREDWAGAAREARRASEEWREYQSRFCLFLDHSELDKISINFLQLEKFSEIEELEQFVGTAVGLKFSIEHMPERERPLVKNIF